MSLTFDEYQIAARRTAVYPDSAKVVYSALSLSGEAGEVANKVKKVLRGDCTAEQMKQKILDEAGDVLWYLSALVSDLDCSLNDVAVSNIQKLSSREERGVVKGSGDNR